MDINHFINLMVIFAGTIAVLIAGSVILFSILDRRLKLHFCAQCEKEIEACGKRGTK